MEEKHNATCSICGRGYYACLSCKDAMKLHPYKTYCCSADCYKMFQVVRGFSTGVYTKDEFKSKLKNIDLSNLDNYIDSIKSLIKDTLKEDKVVVDEIVSEITAENKTEETINENPIYSRKRNLKVNSEVEKTE